MRKILLGVCLLVFSSAAWADVPIAPAWAPAAPVLNGAIAPGEWSAGTVTNIAHGKMVTMNDVSNLYVLLDVVDDTIDNPIVPLGPNDYYVLAIDADLSMGVTANVDFVYDACQDGRTFIKAYYLGGSSFTGCQDVTGSSALGIGFGPTPNSATPHRFWEFRLDFDEIGVDPSTWTTSGGTPPRVRMNAATISLAPAFETAQPDPDKFPNLTNMFQVNLAIAGSFPPGSTGPTFAGVGLVPSTFIGADGYANINIPGYYSATDAPFGGKLNVFGHWNTLSAMPGVKKYRVLYSKDGGPFQRLLQTWTNFKFTGGTWVATAVGPDATDAYAIPNPAEIWYLPNLLISWQSNLFAEGTYELKLELLNNGGGVLAPPPSNSLTLEIVNTPPQVTINGINYNGSPVCACSIVTQGDPPAGFTFNISATDAHGALNAFSLAGAYGNNQSTGTLYSDSYASHMDADGPNQWNGVTSIVVPATPFRASTSCAYTFVLAASSRVQNGYGLLFPHVQYHQSLTILLGSGAGSMVGCP